MGRYRALVGAIAALEWRATASGEPIFSRGWTALTGQPESEVLNGNWVNALHPDDRPVVIESWLKAVQTLTPYTANQRILKANGEYEWFHARAVPIMRQGGRPHEWLGMIIRHQDFIVTARHPAEAETIVTPMQIRAGRAMLQWTLEDLSRESGCPCRRSGASKPKVSAPRGRHLSPHCGRPSSGKDWRSGKTMVSACHASLEERCRPKDGSAGQPRAGDNLEEQGIHRVGYPLARADLEIEAR